MWSILTIRLYAGAAVVLGVGCVFVGLIEDKGDMVALGGISSVLSRILWHAAQSEEKIMSTKKEQIVTQLNELFNDKDRPKGEVQEDLESIQIEIDCLLEEVIHGE